MTQRRSVHSAGSPSKTPQPTTAANPDGRTPAELPSDPAPKPVDNTGRAGAASAGAKAEKAGH
jgi:hypothetical protein